MKNKRIKGFTLIEILISVAILGILLVILIPVFSYSLIRIIDSGHKTQAMYSAQTGVEKLQDGEPFSESTSLEKDLDIVFSSVEIQVAGIVSTIEVPIPKDPDGDSTELKTFIPD